VGYTPSGIEKNANGSYTAYAYFDGVKKRFGRWGKGKKPLPEVQAEYDRCLEKYIKLGQSPITQIRL